MATTLNQYDGSWGQNDKESVVAGDMETAARVLAASKGSDPVLLQRVKEGIQVELPILDVAFRAEVSDPAATLAGCAAYPESYVVPAGSKQVFSCTVVPGWVFDRWQINGVDVPAPEGTQQIALLTIPPYASTVSVTAVVTP